MNTMKNLVESSKDLKYMSAVDRAILVGIVTLLTWCGAGTILYELCYHFASASTYGDLQVVLVLTNISAID